MDKKVVVTGLGVISALGVGKELFWQNLLRGKSGISKVTLFDTSRYQRCYAGQVGSYAPQYFVEERFLKYIGRASKMAIVATKLALKDAGIEEEKLRKGKNGIMLGTTLPEGSSIDISSDKLSNAGFDKLLLSVMLGAFSPAIVCNSGSYFKIKGFNCLLPCACAAGNYTIGYAFDLIRKGELDLAVVGGAEALSRIAFQGFQRLYAMAEEKCSPFDKNRKGMMLGEGAGVLVLESLARAKQRNAEIYAEVLGYGLSCDANHITIPKKQGIEKAMVKALAKSKLKPNQVDYICAHGTGTPANDKAESEAINSLFSKRRVPVSSIKSMLGHSMGAASALEAIACCLAIKDGKIPPTINFTTPDPDCDVDCVPNQYRQAKVKVALNNGFAFGGNNCCVVFGECV